MMYCQRGMYGTALVPGSAIRMTGLDAVKELLIISHGSYLIHTGFSERQEFEGRSKAKAVVGIGISMVKILGRNIYLVRL
jgi:hypothetical protein